MTKFILVSDILESNGKTIRENNLTREHVIPIGALVEIICPEHEDNGIRLYVAHHGRDCDGTPLYSLGLTEHVKWYSNELRDRQYDIFYKLVSGWGEKSLKVIKGVV